MQTTGTTHLNLSLPFLAGLVETVLNAGLRAHPESRERLAGLADKVIALHLQGLELSLYLLPGQERLAVLSHYAGVPDASLYAPPFSLLRMLWEQDSRLVSRGDIRIQGDTGLAQRLLDALRGEELDWEELLARAIGDVPAHWLGRMAHNAQQWQAENNATLERNLSEYLREESRLLPSIEEIEPWGEAIDTLRMDTDRLEQRIKRLEKR